MDVESFFESYRLAFEGRDAPGVVAHFAFPLHVAGEGQPPTLAAVPTPDAWLAQVERLLAAYRTLGVRHARLAYFDVDRVSPHVAHARARWQLGDEKGTLLYEFRAGYTLIETEGALRIVALAHDEGPRLRDRLARHGNASP